MLFIGLISPNCADAILTTRQAYKCVAALLKQKIDQSSSAPEVQGMLNELLGRVLDTRILKKRRGNTEIIIDKECELRLGFGHDQVCYIRYFLA